MVLALWCNTYKKEPYQRILPIDESCNICPVTVVDQEPSISGLPI